MMPELAKRIERSAATIEMHWQQRPRVGIILGTGSGRLTEEITIDRTIAYESIPDFPHSTAPGHKGRLVCGWLENVPVVAMEGRFHVYEGMSLADTTFPIRVMHRLGIETLILSNASGGLNPNFRSGEILVIEDHIDRMSDNPLVGSHVPAAAPRDSDLNPTYDAALIERALQVARREGFAAHRGVYVAVTGPNYETRAEYRYLRAIGGDVVGMSTVPEVIVATQLGLRVLALSTVTNICLPDALTPTQAEDVLVAAESSEKKLRRIVLGVLRLECAPR